MGIMKLSSPAVTHVSPRWSPPSSSPPSLWNVGTGTRLGVESLHTLIGSTGVGKRPATPSAASTGEGWRCAALLIVSPLRFRMAGRSAPRRSRAPPMPESPRRRAPPPGVRGLPPPAGVSFAHGSQRRAEGRWPIMLILIGTVPPVDYGVAGFADRVQRQRAAASNRSSSATATPPASESDPGSAASLRRHSARPPRSYARVRDIPRASASRCPGGALADKSLDKHAVKSGGSGLTLPEADETRRRPGRDQRNPAPTTPCAGARRHRRRAGVGTMFGWKRIVETVGEKIGKTHPTPRACVGRDCRRQHHRARQRHWPPVSTTHVLGRRRHHGGLTAAACSRPSATSPLAWLLTCLPPSPFRPCFTVFRLLLG